MEIDALARAVLDGFERGQLSVPPFPPYAPVWAERTRREAERALAELTPEQRAAAETAPAMPALESLTAVDIGKLGDLEIHLYRAEPGAVALLLIVRGGQLAYTALAGNWFAAPEEIRSGSFPPYDLTMMAAGARALGELDVNLSSMTATNEGPMSIAYEIDRARYEALAPGAREELHRALMPIARDTALLFFHRNGPLRIAFTEPESNAQREERRGQRTAFAEFDAV